MLHEEITSKSFQILTLKCKVPKGVNCGWNVDHDYHLEESTG